MFVEQKGCSILEHSYTRIAERASMEFGNDDLNLVLFEQRPVRRAWFNEEWYYSIVDIVAVLVPDTDPSKYWFDMKRRITAE
jgi:hypothetical protein